MQEDVEQSLRRIFAEGHRWSTSFKSEGGLDIVTAEATGLAPWGSEEEVLTRLESGLSLACQDWLHGYRIQIIAKEDVGPCQLKRKPFMNG